MEDGLNCAKEQNSKRLLLNRQFDEQPSVFGRTRLGRSPVYRVEIEKYNNVTCLRTDESLWLKKILEIYLGEITSNSLTKIC